MFCAYDGTRKETLKPLRSDDETTIHRVFNAEDLGIAGEHDAFSRVVPEKPSRKSNANADGFECARRHIDD